MENRITCEDMWSGRTTRIPEQSDAIVPPVSETFIIPEAKRPIAGLASVMNESVRIANQFDALMPASERLAPLTPFTPAKIEIGRATPAHTYIETAQTQVKKKRLCLADYQLSKKSLQTSVTRLLKQYLALENDMAEQLVE
ncbi:MAG: hypothetical protein WDN66_00315 [Candidatus Saccharibacteria bacterium]